MPRTMASSTTIAQSTASLPVRPLPGETPTNFICRYMRVQHATYPQGGHITRPPNSYMIYRMYYGLPPGGTDDHWKTLGTHQQPYVDAQNAAKALHAQLYPDYKYQPKPKAAKGKQQGQTVQNTPATSTKRPRKKINRRGVDGVSAPKSIGDNAPAYNASMTPAEDTFPFTFTFAAPMPIPAVLAPMQPVQQGFAYHSLPPYGYSQGTNASSYRGVDPSARPAFSLPTDSDFTFIAPKPVQRHASPVPAPQSCDFHEPTVSQPSVEGNAPVVYKEGMAWASDAQGSYHDDTNEVSADQTVVEEAAVAVNEDTETTNPGEGGKVKAESDIMELAPYLVDYLQNDILADINDALDIRDGIEEGLFRGFA